MPPDLARRFVDTEAGAFGYETQGPDDGELVVCAHGFPDHAPTFRGLGRRLAAEGFRVVAPWLRGYHPSTLAGPFDSRRVGADLTAIVDALSPSRPAVLVGHDWGAVAAYDALASRPRRYRKAVILSVPHPVVFARALVTSPAQLRRSWYMAFLNLPGVSDRVVAARDFAFVDRLWRTWSPGLKPEPASMRELKECLARSMPAPLLYYRALAKTAAARLRERMPKIDVPTLYMHGVDDGCIGPAVAAGQERFFSAPLRSVRVERAGHFLHLEAPERVEGEIAQYLIER